MWKFVALLALASSSLAVDWEIPLYPENVDFYSFPWFSFTQQSSVPYPVRTPSGISYVSPLVPTNRGMTRYRQDMCILPTSRFVPDCIINFHYQKMDTKRNKFISNEVRRLITLQELENSGIKITENGIEDMGNVKPNTANYQLYDNLDDTMILDSPHPLIILTKKCFPNIGIPLCSFYESKYNFIEDSRRVRKSRVSLHFFEKYNKDDDWFGVQKPVKNDWFITNRDLSPRFLRNVDAVEATTMESATEVTETQE